MIEAQTFSPGFQFIDRQLQEIFEPEKIAQENQTKQPAFAPDCFLLGLPFLPGCPKALLSRKNFQPLPPRSGDCDRGGNPNKAELEKAALIFEAAIQSPLAAILGTVAPGLIPEVLPRTTGVYRHYLLLDEVCCLTSFLTS